MPSKQLHVWGASSLYVNELCFKEHRGFECKLHRQIFIKHPNKKNKNKKKVLRLRIAACVNVLLCFSLLYRANSALVLLPGTPHPTAQQQLSLPAETGDTSTISLTSYLQRLHLCSLLQRHVKGPHGQAACHFSTGTPHPFVHTRLV